MYSQPASQQAKYKENDRWSSSLDPLLHQRSGLRLGKSKRNSVQEIIKEMNNNK
jgi:hypothetical protein